MTACVNPLASLDRITNETELRGVLRTLHINELQASQRYNIFVSVLRIVSAVMRGDLKSQEKLHEVVRRARDDAKWEALAGPSATSSAAFMRNITTMPKIETGTFYAVLTPIACATLGREGSKMRDQGVKEALMMAENGTLATQAAAENLALDMMMSAAAQQVVQHDKPEGLPAVMVKYRKAYQVFCIEAEQDADIQDPPKSTIEAMKSEIALMTAPLEVFTIYHLYMKTLQICELKCGDQHDFCRRVTNQALQTLCTKGEYRSALVALMGERRGMETTTMQQT